MNLRNPSNYLNSLWDWGRYNHCFGQTGIRITDIDGAVERNGHFLILETKRVGEKIPAGQIRLFNALCDNPRFEVLVIWGEPNAPVRCKFWRYKTVFSGDRAGELISRWFNSVNIS